MNDKYKYIILGNNSDWCKFSISEILNDENVLFFNEKLPSIKNSIKDKLCRIHYSIKINRIINLPFKSIWFKKFTQEFKLDRNDNVIFWFYDRNRLATDEKFIKYLRKTYVNAKFIYMFTNIVKISGASDNNFLHKLNDVYDIVYAFDPQDAKKYRFDYSPLMYSYNEQDESNHESDVFYIGRAKDRLSQLLQAFKKLTSFNLKCNFNIVNVEEEEMKYSDKIQYNKMMSYKEVLKEIYNTNCLIDIIQGESEGFTIKTCEAIFFNKKLITTNEKIKEAPFYNPKYIMVIKDVEDIKEEFFTNYDEVDYGIEARAYFSPRTLMKRVEKKISEK